MDMTMYVKLYRKRVDILVHLPRGHKTQLLLDLNLIIDNRYS